MEVFVAGNEDEISIAILGFGKTATNGVFGIVDGIGRLGTDVNLLNLNRGFESAGVFDVDQNCVVEIDVVVVDWVVELLKHADNHELLAVVAEGAGDSFGGAEERHGEVVADDCDVFAEAIIEELASLEFQIQDLLEVVAGSDDGVGLVDLFANRDCGIANCDWGDTFDVFDFLDSFDVFEREVGLGILTGVS